MEIRHSSNIISLCREIELEEVPRKQREEVRKMQGLHQAELDKGEQALGTADEMHLFFTKDEVNEIYKILKPLQLADGRDLIEALFIIEQDCRQQKGYVDVRKDPKKYEWCKDNRKKLKTQCSKLIKFINDLPEDDMNSSGDKSVIKPDISCIYSDSSKEHELLSVKLDNIAENLYPELNNLLDLIKDIDKFEEKRKKRNRGRVMTPWNQYQSCG